MNSRIVRAITLRNPVSEKTNKQTKTLSSSLLWVPFTLLAPALNLEEQRYQQTAKSFVASFQKFQLELLIHKPILKTKTKTNKKTKKNPRNKNPLAH